MARMSGPTLRALDSPGPWPSSEMSSLGRAAIARAQLEACASFDLGLAGGPQVRLRLEPRSLSGWSAAFGVGLAGAAGCAAYSQAGCPRFSWTVMLLNGFGDLEGPPRCRSRVRRWAGRCVIS